MNVIFLFTSTLLQKIDKIICYSGGYDSSYYLSYYKIDIRTHILAHYLHYQKINNEYDIIQIINLTCYFNITCILGQNIKQYMSSKNLRNARYKFFLTLAHTYIADLVMCHNMSDNIECLIMKYNKCCVSEMVMPIIKTICYLSTKIKIIRPMLHLYRMIITKYTVPLIDDPSNYKTNKLRNRIRQQYQTYKWNSYIYCVFKQYTLLAEQYEQHKYKNYYYNVYNLCLILPFTTSNNLFLTIKTAALVLHYTISPRFKHSTINKLIINKNHIFLNNCLFTIKQQYIYVRTYTQPKIQYIKKYKYKIIVNNIHIIYINSTTEFNINIVSNKRFSIVINNHKHVLPFARIYNYTKIIVYNIKITINTQILFTTPITEQYDL